MAVQRTDEWGSNQAAFEESQIETILLDLGIRIVGQTETVFLSGCPFHHNLGTPAFTVNRSSGLFYCHNPACGRGGTLNQLVSAIRNKGDFDAKRFIHGHNAPVNYVSILKRISTTPKTKSFPQETLNRLTEQFSGSAGEQYMFSRGFGQETLDYFGIGFSERRGSVTVPMHDEYGGPLGLVSRSIDGKVFKNSRGLPKSTTAWNMHRAKRGSGTVVVCESSFDAMKIHQAGFPNVVALLGGSLSERIKEQLETYCQNIVIMTDNDVAGRELGLKIESKVRRKCFWAAQGPEIYPDGAKDACDLTEEQIRDLLSHAVDGVRYRMYLDGVSSWHH